MTSSLHKLLAEGVIRYSQVWEDHALVEGALEIGADDDVLSIGSAGCNVFNALLREPRSVLAIDLNPAQAALIELKLQAITHLTWEELHALLGIAAAAPEDRLALYDRVRAHLGDAARVFWDAREGILARGVHWSGRLEQFFAGFHAAILPTVHDAAATARILAMNEPAQQARALDESYANEALRRAFTSYFTRERLASEGRDPRQMRYVAAMDVAGFFWGRFRWVLSSLPARDNFYLHSFLTGRYASPSAVPPYLRRENHARLRGLVGRVAIEVAGVRDVLEARPVRSFSKANLSDLFEYLSDEDSASLFEALGARLRPRGRVCYWNLLVPREPPDAQRVNLRPMTDRARDLYSRDRSWFYRGFHVEEVVSG